MLYFGLDAYLEPPKPFSPHVTLTILSLSHRPIPSLLRAVTLSLTLTLPVFNMRRWLFARHAASTARNYVVSSSRIPIPKLPLSNSNSPLPSTPPFRTTTTLSPHFRFFSQTSEIPDPPLTSFNDDVTIANDNDAPLSEENENENGVVQGIDYAYADGVEEEEKVYEIDAEEFENVVRLLQNADVETLESSLDSMGFSPHQDFVLKIIETPDVSGYSLVRFLKWALDEKSFNVASAVLESLVMRISGGVLSEKEVYSLWGLVKEIAQKESGSDGAVVNVCVLNEVISSFSRLGKGRAANEVFDEFESFQCVPNADTYYFTIEALCRRKDFDQAWSVCQKMLDAETMPDGEKIGKIVSWFCKGNLVRQAHLVYVAAKDKGKQLPLLSINFLIVKLCQQNETVRLDMKDGKHNTKNSKLVGKSGEENENVQLALEMLNDIPREEKKRAVKPFSAVVQALCRIKDVDAAKELILKMIADGPPPGNAVFNYVITEYAQAGQMVQAMGMLRVLESRGLKPDLYTHAVIMSGYSNGGEMEEARKILEEAKKKHVKLTPVMYHTLIRGYCKLEQFDEALKLLAEMKDFGVRPSVDEYEKLIQSLCLKALDWETAEKLQEEMKENGLHLKGISRGLIRAVKEMEKEVVDGGNISSTA
ncbi:hypothetical protein RIF29_18270 [Crotalaria pallida]|uniref:Pentatricopeptide repeat protein n=1 Tax=Crotalaria pallida TaxID=3830 RepID=A0AAN9IH78_CROPI